MTSVFLMTVMIADLTMYCSSFGVMPLVDWSPQDVYPSPLPVFFATNSTLTDANEQKTLAKRVSTQNAWSKYCQVDFKLYNDKAFSTTSWLNLPVETLGKSPQKHQ